MYTSFVYFTFPIEYYNMFFLVTVQLSAYQYNGTVPEIPF